MMTVTVSVCLYVSTSLCLCIYLSMYLYISVSISVSICESMYIVSIYASIYSIDVLDFLVSIHIYMQNTSETISSEQLTKERRPIFNQEVRL